MGKYALFKHLNPFGPYQNELKLITQQWYKNENRGGNIWVQLFLDKSVTLIKPSEIRMDLLNDGFVVNQRQIERILYEMDGVS